jgi:hypothetical protein
MPRTMTLLRERRQSRRDRWCFVCGAPVPWGGGVGHGHLGIVTHQGACCDAVAAEERIYDRSPRGRWRPKRDILARLQARRLSREAADQEGGY